MLDVLVYGIMVLYALSILFILVHSLFDAHLIFHYLRSRTSPEAPAPAKQFFPFVTVQLPVYNEVHVVERLLEAVADIDYPREKWEIQVLDDSTDNTSALIARKISSLEQQGLSIVHIRRGDREDFKAGALKHGLRTARGELIAVFDADFVPQKNFLKETIPVFADPAVGMVQTKWGHINRGSSVLANLQAMALDGHFSIEQRGRNAAGYFMNFNGTGGVWRKSTILDAGNWTADTLTEDFDLSYRAQLKGWKFKYLEHIETPAELPPMVSALKAQQFRWMKGGAETARKHLGALLSSSHPLPVKLHGILQLTYNLGFISMLVCAVLSLPLLYIQQDYPQHAHLFACARVVGLTSFIYVFHQFISFYNSTGGSPLRKIAGFGFSFPLFGALFIGMSLNNAVAIVQGYMGIRSGFVRTPKFSSGPKIDKAPASEYAQVKLDWITLVEGLLACYFLFGVVQAFLSKAWGTMPFLVLSFIGFSGVFFGCLREKIAQKGASQNGRQRGGRELKGTPVQVPV